MELESALKNRRSIRKFKYEKVPLTVLKEIIKAGTYAPSASNRQHWHFVVVDDSEIIKKICLEAGAQKLILNAPVIIAVFYDSNFNKEYSANIQSVSAAVQNMLLKTHELSYGSCWVAGVGHPEIVSKILKVPPYLKLLCLVMLGKPDESPFPPPKKPMEEVMSLNYFKGAKTLPSSINPADFTLNEIKDHQKYTSRAKYLGKDYDVYSKEEIKKIRSIILNNLPGKKSKILFVMSYDGAILKHIASSLNDFKVIDAELSPDSINFVKFKTPTPQFIVMDEKIPLEDKNIDLAVMLFSLERFPEPMKIIKEIARVLKPNSKLLIFLKNKDSFYGLMHYSMEHLLKLKNIESFISSGPFKPLSALKLKKFLNKNFLVSSKALFFIPAELNEYNKRISGYLKRHGKKLSFLKLLIKPAIYISILLFYLTKWVKSPNFSSSVCIIAKKKN